MLRPLMMSLALATFAVAISYQAASTGLVLVGDPDDAPASDDGVGMREAWFVPDGADRRFVDDEGCVTTCRGDVQHEFDEICIHECEVSQ